MIFKNITSRENTVKVLGELSELQIKALLPTLTLELSLVKVFFYWPRNQQVTSKMDRWLTPLLRY